MSNDFTTDYDLATHVSNYCICDGIIHLQQGDIGTDDGVDKLWLSCGALQREMRLDADQLQNPYFPSPVEKSLLKRMAYWTSPTYGFVMIPDPDEQIPKGMFQQFDKLCVLKLSACKFSFTSPPFLCCHNLRFLWLDHCQEGDSTAEVMEEDARQFLQRLWVLDVRYSNGAFLSQEMMNFMTHLKELNVIGEEDTFDTDLLQGQQLCNIRKLRFTKSHVYEVTTRVSGMNKLELFEFSENTSVRWLYVESCNSLESVIIYGSTELLEIALTGCIKVKNLFLSGSFPELVAIAIAGAVVEILDLRAVTAPKLESLFLPDCEKLCAIRWPSPADGKRNIYLSKLMIDTKQKEGTAIDTNSPPSVSYYWNMFKKKINFDYHISVRDARILQSLKPVKDNFSSKAAHVEISTISSPTGSFTDVASTKDGRMRSSCGQRVQVKLKQPKDTAMYTDVVVTLKDTSTQQQQEAANEGDSSGAPGIMRTCPPPPEVLSEGCYIHIEDPSSRTKSQTASITLPGFICDCAKILHVHDCLHIASILSVPIASATWNKLQWCRVEQCPNLECVFSQLGGPEGNNNDTDMFKKLTTTWVSHLLKARYIWKWSSTSPIVPQVDTCENLTLLHIDCCPRLIQVTSWPPPMGTKELDRLEFLEILWCCDLSVAFHFYDTSNMLEWYLLKLIKHVHLHELPKLRNICNIGVTVMMPELKTIKIKGCWSLRRLPVVRKNVVECDCEKEWWDRLEWESVKHARHYKPIHPRHYKKTMLRGSILR
ncbi:hypothetical protein PR202_gb16781 [Eleusine coracana subsp. coracana]|uniref:Disease resistance protein At4g27190-like leucine-rich repeats domain-containing protein n=1 Tax=Eleusine coracana subsp. coracana TaxID=191504 RepID=A0AAV5EZ07_ELECO|nr:hypothetical protein PR202_gb16724 [Eleusine coracana subsp. coracana]GJN28633.1 hypothetical protein PR202_gb16781 [Eleusine coracana subsp. coracana]